MSFQRCPFDTVAPVFSHIFKIQQYELIHLSGAWFLQLVEVTENLPLCVLLILPTYSLGFPVIYANSQLQNVLGLARAEWIGKACPLLGPHALCDPHTSLALQDLLFRAEPGRTSGFYKVGPLVENAVSSDVELSAQCKPLYDESGIHRFSLCVLSSSVYQQRQIAGDFLTSVPHMIFR